MKTDSVSVSVFPMHGQRKLSREGYRTRDGHMIEWFGRMIDGDKTVAVFSRPEPLPFAMFDRAIRGHIAPGTTPVTSTSWRIPSARDRRRWWVDSATSFSGRVVGPVVTWNPFISKSNVWADVLTSGKPIVADLLDDWSIHYAFRSIRDEVEGAYAELFRHATFVSANAEGTLELARRFGRTDARLITNGCDPERFSSQSVAEGPLTIGYVGKIGKRLDLELILEAAHSNPGVRFIFAGPILDAEYRRPMNEEANIELLGDVHYSGVPELLQRFDIGWVPHRVGDGEVGGDVIKTYEYRAAGLPVLSTPIRGASSRGLDSVHVLPRGAHSGWIADAAASGPRIERIRTTLPPDVSWQSKASILLEAAGVQAAAIRTESP